MNLNSQLLPIYCAKVPTLRLSFVGGTGGPLAEGGRLLHDGPAERGKGRNHQEVNLATWEQDVAYWLAMVIG